MRCGIVSIAPVSGIAGSLDDGRALERLERDTTEVGTDRSIKLLEETLAHPKRALILVVELTTSPVA